MKLSPRDCNTRDKQLKLPKHYKKVGNYLMLSSKDITITHTVDGIIVRRISINRRAFKALVKYYLTKQEINKK